MSLRGRFPLRCRVLITLASYNRVAAPARKQKAQGGPAEDPTTTMTSAPGSDLADRALRGVARKLSRDLSVEYTVNELMREAKDTYNLANIFVGA